MTEKTAPPVPEGPASGPASVETYLRLADLGADARGLAEIDFAQRYGEVFLLHHGPLGTLTQAERRSQTRYSEGPDGGDSVGGPARAFLAFPVRATGRSPFPNFISIGRVRNNDVIIEEPSLSKFHAYLRRGDDGVYTLQDAGSTNGTRIDGKLVPFRDQGPPVPLRPGSSIQLGDVRLSFVTAAQVRELVRRLGA